MLSVEGLSFQYRNRPLLLKDVSFTLRPGKILGVLGHNGSGKSTLLRLISRLIPLKKGRITWMNKDIREYSRKEFYQNGGALIENPAFYDHLSLRDNLAILDNYHQNVKSGRLHSLIDQLGLADNIALKTGTFSTGMRQRAGLASVMYYNPALLLLDEPTTGLDPDGIILTRKMLKETRGNGTAIIVTGHHLSELDKLVDEFIILKNGEMIFHGPIESVREYSDLEEFYLSLTQSKNQ